MRYLLILLLLTNCKLQNVSYESPEQHREIINDKEHKFAIMLTVFMGVVFVGFN